MSKVTVLEIANMEGRYGIENYIMNILRNIEKDKIRIVFMSYSKGPFDMEIKSYGCEIFRVPLLGMRISKIWSHIKQVKLLLKQHPEIQTVHIHGNTSIGCLDAIIFKILRIKKIIVHSHNDGCNGIRSLILHSIAKIIINRCIDYKLACSLKAGKWMFGDTGNVKVLKNAIDLEKYRFNYIRAIDLRKKLKLENLKVIGHVGRFEKQKNHIFLLKVFKKMHEIDPNTRLLLVGDGTLGEKIEIEYKKMDLNDVVIRIKECDYVNEILQVMDVFVFPSLWEGLGISLVEAQASGLKCIVSDIIKEEVCVTNLIEKYSLLGSKEIWVEAIKRELDKETNKRDSTKYIEQLRNNGYDIKEATKILQDIYLKNS